ncbi:MAG: NAD(P)/FAD-dependent oxidoreductase [Campylobacterales bacterium]
MLDKKDLSTLSRRDAMKLLGLMSGGATLSASSASAATEAKALSTNANIPIVGGGSAGIDMAARLNRELDGASITIVDPNDLHVYQPGQTLVGCGVYSYDHITWAKQKDYIPNGVKWIKDIVVELNPDSNQAIVADGQVLTYDYLILTPGMKYEWEKIDGLSHSDIGKDGIHSVFDLEGSLECYKGLEAFSEGSGGDMIFTHPATPIKCGGAPKKINMMSDAYLRRHGTRGKANITFCPAGGSMFSIPSFDAELKRIYTNRDMNMNLSHNLVAIDKSNKIATFEHTVTTEVEEYDEILEETIMVSKSRKEMVDMPYDFLHVTPPMRAVDVVANSPLAWDRGSAAEGGWAMADQFTLQHLKYENVFVLGDVAGIPLGKTGASARKQAPIVVENLKAVMQGNAPQAKFNGYTACPMLTDYGLVLLAEFGYNGKLLPTIPFLEPAKQRYIWWLMKVYVLEPLYYHGMLRGIV